MIMTLTFGFLISSLQEGGEREKNLETYYREVDV